MMQIDVKYPHIIHAECCDIRCYGENAEAVAREIVEVMNTVCKVCGKRPTIEDGICTSCLYEEYQREKGER